MRSLLFPLALALVAPFATASIFIFPGNGTNVENGQYLNVTWRTDITDALLGAGTDTSSSNTVDPEPSGHGSSSTASDTATATATASSTASMSATIVGRADAQSGSASASGPSASSSASGADTTSAPNASEGPGSSSASTSSSTAVSNSTIAADAPAPTASADTVRCTDGIPDANATGTPMCSKLELFFPGPACGAPIGLAANFNVSKGWVQVPLPYVAPGDGYRFQLSVRDGEGEDDFLSEPFTVRSAA